MTSVFKDLPQHPTRRHTTPMTHLCRCKSENTCYCCTRADASSGTRSTQILPKRWGMQQFCGQRGPPLLLVFIFGLSVRQQLTRLHGRKDGYRYCCYHTCQHDIVVAEAGGATQSSNWFEYSEMRSIVTSAGSNTYMYN